MLPWHRHDMRPRRTKKRRTGPSCVHAARRRRIDPRSRPCQKRGTLNESRSTTKPSTTEDPIAAPSHQRSPHPHTNRRFFKSTGPDREKISHSPVSNHDVQRGTTLTTPLRRWRHLSCYSPAKPSTTEGPTVTPSHSRSPTHTQTDDFSKVRDRNHFDRVVASNPSLRL